MLSIRQVFARTPVTLWDTWLAILWQASFILCLDQLYEVGRGLIPSRPHKAMDNALRIIHWENSHQIFREPSIQRYWLGNPHFLGWWQIPRGWIIDGLNMYYLYAHFLGTALFLIWLYFRRRTAFRFVRDIIFTSTAISFIIFIVFPTAPPRLVPHQLLVGVPDRFRFVDTLTLWLDPRLQKMQVGYNPYAAMPSLHFVWALIVGITLFLVGRNLAVRLLGPLYVAMMLATILISANHYILDAVGSVVVVAVATTLVWLVDSVASGRLRLGSAWSPRQPFPT